MWVITALSGRSAAPFDLQVQPSFWDDVDSTEAVVPQNLCSSLAGVGLHLCEQHLLCGHCSLLHPQPKGMKTWWVLTHCGLLTLPLSPEHREHFHFPVALTGSRQQSDNSRSEDARAVPALILCLWIPSPAPPLLHLCSLHWGLPPAQAAIPAQSLLWNLHICISRGDAISSWRGCFQCQCNITFRGGSWPQFCTWVFMKSKVEPLNRLRSWARA